MHRQLVKSLSEQKLNYTFVSFYTPNKIYSIIKIKDQTRLTLHSITIPPPFLTSRQTLLSNFLSSKLGLYLPPFRLPFFFERVLHLSNFPVFSCLWEKWNTSRRKIIFSQKEKNQIVGIWYILVVTHIGGKLKGILRSKGCRRGKLVTEEYSESHITPFAHQSCFNKIGLYNIYVNNVVCTPWGHGCAPTFKKK